MRSDPTRTLLGLLALAIAGSILDVFPALDLGASRLFYDAADGFLLSGVRSTEGVRYLIWRLSILVFLVALAGLVAAAFRARMLGLGWRTWGFIVTLYLLGPVLLVNRVLKENWGRARPADITEFGGTLAFSSPWPPSDQCLSNCSFVSGEVSGAVVLAVALLTLRPALSARLPAGLVRAGTVLAILFPVLVIVQRVAAGRHFLSDAIFAALFMLLLAVALRRLFRLDDRRSN